MHLLHGRVRGPYGHQTSLRAQAGVHWIPCCPCVDSLYTLGDRAKYAGTRARIGRKVLSEQSRASQASQAHEEHANKDSWWRRYKGGPVCPGHAACSGTQQEAACRKRRRRLPARICSGTKNEALKDINPLENADRDQFWPGSIVPKLCHTVFPPCHL